MKTVKRINRDTYIVEVKEKDFEGVRLVTEEEYLKGWSWDGSWTDRMILDMQKENRRRSNI